MAIHIEWIIKYASGCESLIDRKRIKDEQVLLHSTKMDQENVILVFSSSLIDNIFSFLRNDFQYIVINVIKCTSHLTLKLLKLKKIGEVNLLS